MTKQNNQIGDVQITGDRNKLTIKQKNKTSNINGGAMDKDSCLEVLSELKAAIEASSELGEYVKIQVLNNIQDLEGEVKAEIINKDVIDGALGSADAILSKFESFSDLIKRASGIFSTLMSTL